MVDSEEISQTWCPFLNYIIKLKEELKCFVCNGLFRIPKLLPCDHIVCSDCIITLLASEHSACLSCQNPFRNEDTRHAFHAERMVSLFQEMDAAIGSIIQQRSSPKNVPGDKPSGVHNVQDKPSHSPFSKKVSLARDEPPGLHNAQDKPSHSLLSKKISLGGDEPSGVHNAQDKPRHSGSHDFPSANYRTSKRRVDELLIRHDFPAGSPLPTSQESHLNAFTTTLHDKLGASTK
ncbi:uncharacterized protein LOC141837119 [Curcuma longa]|uniref:uncharacterized protein LOC141837119 n=1 Tax=Curcuma longa TaxID=136217 RepID=UPI003D9ED17F